MFRFQLTATCNQSRARTGVLETAHGGIRTPVFMPVGTLGTVKSVTPEELSAAGVQILLGNTYHLYLRPGIDIIRRFSGLHRFMNWQGPILTDSGGFQIFSLARLTKIDADGALFRSHIDGSSHLLTPESAVSIQRDLGADILMCLDQCIPYPADREAARLALERTTAWAARCKQRWLEEAHPHGALFGIVQGGMYPELRKRSCDELLAMDFPGYAVGGMSVGEPKAMLFEVADAALSYLPDAKPRYVMGVGTPEDIVELVGCGADMFDCVLPTRNARNGQLFTAWGTLNIANAQFREDTEPVEPGCGCYTCRNFSRAYLRHLYMSRELLAYRLNSIHNIFFYNQLMSRIRQAIDEKNFSAFKKDFYQQRKV